jgi:hypothetical protein
MDGVTKVIYAVPAEHHEVLGPVVQRISEARNGAVLFLEPDEYRAVRSMYAIQVPYAPGEADSDGGEPG